MIEQLLTWIGQHPQAGLWAVLMIALLESLAVVGLLVPGWVLLVGIGAIIGTGELHFWPIVLAAFTGASIGEAIGFLVGRYYHDRIAHWPIFARHPDWLSKSQIFFERHGAASVAFGRFFGPLRAFVPLVAGVAQMPLARFMAINLVSAAVWAPVYLMPGILAGAAIELDGTMASAILMLMVGLAIFSWLAGKAILGIFRRPSIAEYSPVMDIIKASVSVVSVFVILVGLTHGQVGHEFFGVLKRVATIIASP